MKKKTRKTTGVKHCLECAICKEAILSSATLECGHSFCKCCVTEHFKYKKSCPICRKVLSGGYYPSYSLDALIQHLLSPSQLKRYNVRKSEEASHVNNARIGMKLDVLDSSGEWRVGWVKLVVDMPDCLPFLLVSYQNGCSESEELIAQNSQRLATFGCHT